MRRGPTLIRLPSVLLAIVCGSLLHAAAEPLRLPAWPVHADQPQVDLVDTSGSARSLADFHGRVAVVIFGYLHCPDFCPAELTKLAMATKLLGAEAKHIQVIFITLDPARDAPAQLAQYVTYFDARFIGLTGNVDQINRAASSFHINFAKVSTREGYDISHSTATFVLDKSGRLRLLASPHATAVDFAHDLALLAAE